MDDIGNCKVNRHGNRVPTREGVLAAAQAVARVVPPTPLIAFDWRGVRVFAKCESMQPVGAFKLRGAWWRLSSLDADERARGVVAFSSGNHAQGVAWTAQRLGIAATIVMPHDAPAAKRDATLALGAEVIGYDRARESREAIAAALAEQRGATLVPSFDDPWVIEGQGSAAIEAVAQLAALGLPAPHHLPTLRHLIVPCGGGGLAAGCVLAHDWDSVTTVEPEGWDDMRRSLNLGRIVPVGDDAPPTACDALMTTRVSHLTFDILRARGATGMAVSEAAIEDAIRFAFRTLRIVLEPGGAVALAALLGAAAPPRDGTLILLSGGNIDPARFAAIVRA